MSTYRPSRTAYFAAVPAVVTSVLATIEGCGLYTSHNADRCSGGIGWIGPGLLLYATLVCALLASLLAFIVALVAVLRGRHWVWFAGLIAAVALGTLVSLSADTPFAHQLVGTALGVGCSWFYPDVMRSFVPLIVAAPTLAFFLLARRRS
jgi:hypothetical protein